MKYISYEKYKKYIEDEGWVFDPTTYKEMFYPHALKQLVFRKNGDDRMLLVGVMGKDGTKPMQLTDIVTSIHYYRPTQGMFGYERVDPKFSKQPWKGLSKDF